MKSRISVILTAVAAIFAIMLFFAPTQAGDSAQRTLDREERAADLFRKHAKWYGSVFLVMQKSEEGLA